LLGALAAQSAVVLIALGFTPPSFALEPLQYRGAVRIHPEAARLSAELTIHVPLAGERDTLRFYLNPGLQVSRLAGPAILRHEHTRVPEGPVWARGVLDVHFDPHLAGEVVVFEIEYDGAPDFPADGINQIAPDWIELSVDSAWHPVLSSLTRELRVDLSLHLSEVFEVVTSGEVENTSTGVRIQSRFPQIDFAFVAARQLGRAQAAGVEVFHRAASDSTLARLIEVAGDCRDWLEQRFGKGPRLPPLRIVVAGRNESGYARDNYVVLSRVENRDALDLTNFLCHEFGHFWSRGAAPGTVENWLNEGFAELISAHAVRDLHGQGSYDRMVRAWNLRAADAGSIWTEDDRRRRAHAVQYAKAPLLLHRLEARIGKPAFAELLSRYALQPINSTPDLLVAIEEIAGPKHRRWFRRQLARPGPLQ